MATAATYEVGKELTVLSFGGGQDSTAILYKLLHDHEWIDQYAPRQAPGDYE